MNTSEMIDKRLQMIYLSKNADKIRKYKKESIQELNELARKIEEEHNKRMAIVNYFLIFIVFSFVVMLYLNR